MHCYQHRETVSVGMCKVCQKAVCPVCAKDTGVGLVCSDACLAELRSASEITKRARQIYGVGANRKSKLPNTGVLFYFFFALVCLGFGLYPLADGKSAQWYLVITGAGFLLFGVMAHVRTRKLTMNI